MDKRHPIYDVIEERERQDEKWGVQSHPDGTAVDEPDLYVKVLTARAHWFRDRREHAFASGRGNWRLILDEEVNEAYAATTEEDLYKELIQVAAVAVAWAENIKRRLS